MDALGEELDWFEKDEDEIVQDFKSQTQKKPVIQDNIEYIDVPTSDHIPAVVSNINRVTKTKIAKFTTADLRKIAALKPLDSFLYVQTTFEHEPNYFCAQIAETDALERVLLYTRVLASICELELPGFHVELLRNFVANEELLTHFQRIATKLFNIRYKTMWTDEQRVDEIVHDMQTLLLQAEQHKVLTEKATIVMKHIKLAISGSDAPTVAQRQVCIEFGQHLDRICVDKNDENKTVKQQTPTEIYPTLDELQQTLVLEKSVHQNEGLHQLLHCKYDNVHNYIMAQKKLLREDFMIPLRSCVLALKETQAIDAMPRTQVFRDVHIVLNARFLQAHRHEMVFVDMLGGQREGSGQTVNELKHSLRQQLSTLKTGTLLCFATNTDFENLILATVTYTDSDILRKFYVSIDIVRQYNIGNIYDKPLLMFEAPAFFEPYRNVYNYLSTCSAADFPMRQYIVFGESNVKAPSYLPANASYKNEDCSFKLNEQQVPRKLPLNATQRTALVHALTHELCLIQGPPGTGKTHLSVELLKILLKNAKTPILLITYTNESLDKFLLKLSAYTDSIARFGSQTRNAEINKYNVRNVADGHLVNPRLKRLYFVTDQEFRAKFHALQLLHDNFDGTEEDYQKILVAQAAVRHMQCKLATIRLLFQYYVVREKGVIAMTTTCAAKTNFLFRLLRTSIVVFEEAAEILESHVLACLTPHTEHIIMIGDHMQLQPYTSSYQHSRTYALNVSLFERLLRQQLRPVVLKTQYRMRPAIAGLISTVFYTELHNDDVVESYPLVRRIQKNVYFVTHTEKEQQRETDFAYFNPFECDQLLQLALYLIKVASYADTDIVVLSPYAEQVSLLQRQFSKETCLRHIQIATVDSFQGLEANIVLLSLVRSNDKSSIGFLAENNRICVALSRAKHGLYMIGNLQLLSACSTVWCIIAEKLKAQDAIGTAFPFADDETVSDSAQ